MLPQIHIFDLIAVSCLTAGLVALIYNRVKGIAHSKAVAFVSLLAVSVLTGFVVLHVWAHFRPLAPVVQINRHLSSAERARFSKQFAGPVPAGFVLPDINDFTTSEYIPLAHANRALVEGVDIGKIRRLLAWHSWLPEMPKQLIVVPADSAGGETKVIAEFNVRLLQQKRIEFVKRDGAWTIRNVRQLRYCGEEPTDFVTRSKAVFPIDFSGYHSTF